MNNMTEVKPILAEIPLAFEMKELAAEARNIFDDRLYARVLEEMVAQVKSAASKGETCVQVIYQLMDTRVVNNVLKKLLVDMEAVGYTVSFSPCDAKGFFRFSITWA